MDKNLNEDYCSKNNIDCVIEYTKCNLETAKTALLNNNGDVVNSIMKILDSKDLNKNGEKTVNNNHGIKRKFDKLSNINNDDSKANKEKKTIGGLQKLVDFSGWSK